MKTKTILLGLLAAAAVAGCTADPRAYETAPVVLDTPMGPVTCQLYTKDIVMWDRAISAPEDMDPAQADALCKAEGRRMANS